MRTTMLISGVALTLATVLGAGQAFAGHDRKVIVHETTHYSSPTLAYHSGPVSVYYGPTHSTRVITTTQRYSSGHKSYHGKSYRQPSYGKHHGPHGHAHGYYRNKSKHDYRGHAPTRGSWSRDRRDVIYVNKNARKGSNYRNVERSSVVIRERRR